MIDAMLTAAGLTAVTSVPSDASIWTISRSPPIAQGRSWHRRVRMTPMITPSSAGRAQLIGPGACGAVPAMSKHSLSARLVSRQQIR